MIRRRHGLMLRPVRRRDLLKIAGAGTLIAAAPRRAHSIPGRLREVADAALAAARAGGATYADVRFVRTRAERLGTRDDHLVSASTSESYGVGVRVLVKGTWGFAGTQDVTVSGARAAASEAAEIARANARLRKEPGIVVGAWLREAALTVRGAAGQDRLGGSTIEPIVQAISDDRTEPRTFRRGGIEVTVTARYVSVRRYV